MLTSPYAKIDLFLYFTPKQCAASYITFKSYFWAMASMASISHGLPNTCVAIIAVVLGVIASSILAASIFNDSLSISTNTGVQFCHMILLVVATKEKGVVMISP